MDREEIIELFEEKEDAIDDIKRIQGDVLSILNIFEVLKGRIYHKDHLTKGHDKVIELLLSIVAELGLIKNNYEVAYSEEIKKGAE